MPEVLDYWRWCGYKKAWQNALYVEGYKEFQAASRWQICHSAEYLQMIHHLLTTTVGVECFGPFDVKRGRSHVKRYGVIFTCLALRAVHIEVAASLDTNSINALRRFLARWGQVKELCSDNGTNFVGADRELRRSIEQWNHSQIHEELLQRGIKWTFNPPTGSHHGGAWERLIRSIRKVLNSTLRVQTLDEEGLHTVLCKSKLFLIADH